MLKHYNSIKDNVNGLMLFKGMSMYFTLKPFDRLYIKPYGQNSRMKPGDVVIFPSPTGSGTIVHRIVKIDEEMIKTKGDNNPAIDHWVLTRDKIIGQVTYVYRGKNKLGIYGGRNGLWWAFLVALSRWLKAKIYYLLKFFYCWIAARSFTKGLFNRLLRAHFFSIGSEGFEVLLLLGNRIIGRYTSRQKKWHIRRRYAALIGTERLSAFLSEAHHYIR